VQKLANDNSAPRIHFHDPDAPAPTVVAPSVFVAVRNDRGKLLLVRRCDSGTWELPGGRVDVGESADVAALPVQPAARLLIVHALSGADEPHLG
jgi:8-oxo-dGTP pyrophosphatase MutT (NUDIX family)